MNKNGLAAAVAEKTGLDRREAVKAVDAVLETITEVLAGGEKVQISGFGSFETKKRASYTGHDPRTNSPITIPAATVPSFKAGKGLKDAVAK